MKDRANKVEKLAANKQEIARSSVEAVCFIIKFYYLNEKFITIFYMLVEYFIVLFLSAIGIIEYKCKLFLLILFEVRQQIFIFFILSKIFYFFFIFKL